MNRINHFDKTYHKVMKSFEIDFLYDVPSYLINEEKDAYVKLIHSSSPNRSVCPSFIEDDIICETTYFQNWDVNQSCIDAVKDILERIKASFKKSGDIGDLELNVNVSELLKKINLNGITNYKNFHKFLDLMKQHCRGHLKISIGKSNAAWSQDSYYEPSMKFGYPPKNGMIVDSYYQYLEDLTKDCDTWHEKINKIMEDLFNLDDYGVINISALALNRGDEELGIVISHEISHFLKFLVRLNGLNYKYGLNCSRSDLSYLNGQNYESKPDEWKELAATYIEELALIFQRMDIVHSHANSLKFIDAFLNWSGIDADKNADAGFLVKMTHELNSHFHSREIERFFKTTYENSKSPSCVRNTWKVLVKWLKNEFNRRFN